MKTRKAQKKLDTNKNTKGEYQRCQALVITSVLENRKIHADSNDIGKQWT